MTIPLVRPREDARGGDEHPEITDIADPFARVMAINALMRDNTLPPPLARLRVAALHQGLAALRNVQPDATVTALAVRVGMKRSRVSRLLNSPTTSRPATTGR